MKADNGALPLIVGVGFGLFVLLQSQADSVNRRQVLELQQRLYETETRFQSYREGVMSHD